ncbi:AP-4 complex accessory subunit tepsin isoform X2 [Kryptolebias marmoratus]|uniref:AP-4 complex accessory subunit tepsin isoform X2 n=1 Tax=Kryptolebias marmoratus TaxID=37003 RepID=UPI0007F8C0D4|nr:AP-4 complex accessory subunit tepsin isoform X2 [Kryptolebias marmoratus]
MATFMERLAFLQKVPALMKATADDETPCPGYLFQEIGKICHESSGYGQCLLEYLLERLQVESCHVKLKVLKIFVHLCDHGSKHFLTELRRNSTFIQQASIYSGPPDPIHGTALYQKVRNTAQEVARLLFTDAVLTNSRIPPHSITPPTMGMGSTSSHSPGLQGFGYSSGKQGTGSDSLLDKIQKAAEVVASAVLPPTEHQGIRLHDNHYRAVVAPSAPIEVAVPACAYNLPARRSKASQRCPGQVGGGWEETDSNNSSSHNSSQEIATNSRASVGSKSAGTRSQSGASRESNGDLSERTEALQLGDCGQETTLINKLTEGSRVFLTREESQQFLKECFILNCEVVMELLSNKLQDPSYTVKMRALSAVSCFMTSDLLSLEQIFGATQRRLRQLSEGPPGPVANKATKILRQFEALMGGSQHAARQDTVNSSQQATTNQPYTSDNSKLFQSEPISADVIQTSNQPSSPDLDQAWRCSTEMINAPEEEKLTVTQQESVDNPVELVRTADVKSPSSYPEVIRDGSSPLSPDAESVPSSLSRLSLFRGMELVTKGRMLCERDTPHTEFEETEDSLGVTETVQNSNSSVTSVNTSEEVTSGCNPVGSDKTQPASAFSFLNF